MSIFRKNFHFLLFLSILNVSWISGLTLSHRLPILINTWPFEEANVAGWRTLQANSSALDAIVESCRKCQDLQCDHTVGWGGSPDEQGESALDAMIMDGPSHSVGAIAALENIKDVIAVARAVMEHTDHTMLVGRKATEFALKMGFPYEDLTSAWSRENHCQWLKNNCQPNFWKNVEPNPKMNCGPYEPKSEFKQTKRAVYPINRENHDTIGVVAIDINGRIASGTSTNGANHKIPGRVGDSSIAGAGSYVDQEVGGAAATGDGDVIMRYLVSFQTVEGMRAGLAPDEAARNALKKVLKKYPKAQIGVVAVDMKGNSGAACMNIDGGFPYVLASASYDSSVLKVDCLV